jgi:hypothetical protein
MKKSFILLALIFISMITMAADNGKWYSLSTIEEYVADYALKPGQKQEVEIKADKEVMVCIKTDNPYVLTKKYMNNPPIEIKQIDGKGSFAGSSGGTMFKPVEGKIRLTVTNKIKETFKVVVYTVGKRTSKATPGG